MLRAALVTAAAGLVATTAAPALAQSTMRTASAVPMPAWYVGGGIGYAKLTERIADTSLPVTGATESAFSMRTSATSAKAYVGFNMNRYLAVEAAYVGFGDFNGRRDVTQPFTGNVDVRWKVQGLAIGLKPTWRLTDSFAVFALGGAARLQTRVDTTSTFNGGFSSTEKNSRWSVYYGLGAEYDFTRNFGVRAEWELFKHATNTNLMSIGGGAIDYNTFFASGYLRF